MLRRILQTAELSVDEPSLVWDALADFEAGSADFADCLIAQGNRAAGCEVTFSFDCKVVAGRYFEQMGRSGAHRSAPPLPGYVRLPLGVLLHDRVLRSVADIRGWPPP